MFNNNNNLNFSDVLQKGLGRAFDYVKQQDKLQIREELLNACLHNLAYDPQCESSRAEWLFELICLTGDSNFYRERIFHALPRAEEFWDLKQLYDLVLIWAKQGDEKAREIIYTTFKQQDFNESWLGGKQIIALDGIKGLLAVAEIVGGRPLKNDKSWEDDSLIIQASKHHDASEVWSALEREALNNSRIKAYLDAVKSQQKRRNSYIKKDRKISFADVIKRIEQQRISSYILSRFGRDADEYDIEKIFARLLLERRKEQLLRYLYVFRKRAFPRLDRILFDLATSDDNQIQSAAITALANNTDNSIGSFAIKLIQKQPNSIDNGGLKLFINNYQTEDFQIIGSVLNESHNIDTRHRIGMDLMKIIDRYKTPELINYSIWIYENTPCTYCRRSILKILIKLQQVPSAIIKECSQDCSPEIRALVNAYQ